MKPVMEPLVSNGPIGGDDSYGTVALRLVTPVGTTLDQTVTWTLDNRPAVTERWDVRSSGTALEYPWGQSNTNALIGWIEGGRKFTIQFTEATTNTTYTATFGAAGLQIEAPSVVAACSPPSPNNPWDY